MILYEAMPAKCQPLCGMKCPQLDLLASLTRLRVSQKAQILRRPLCHHHCPVQGLGQRGLTFHLGSSSNMAAALEYLIPVLSSGDSSRRVKKLSLFCLARVRDSSFSSLARCCKYSLKQAFFSPMVLNASYLHLTQSSVPQKFSARVPEKLASKQGYMLGVVALCPGCITADSINNPPMLHQSDWALIAIDWLVYAFLSVLHAHLWSLTMSRMVDSQVAFEAAPTEARSSLNASFASSCTAMQPVSRQSVSTDADPWTLWTLPHVLLSPQVLQVGGWKSKLQQCPGCVFPLQAVKVRMRSWQATFVAYTIGFLGSGKPTVAFCSAFHLAWAASDATPFSPGVLAGLGLPGEGSAIFKTCIPIVGFLMCLKLSDKGGDTGCDMSGCVAYNIVEEESVGFKPAHSCCFDRSTETRVLLFQDGVHAL